MKLVQSVNDFYPNMDLNGLTGDTILKNKLAYPYEFFNIN